MASSFEISVKTHLLLYHVAPFRGASYIPVELTSGTVTVNVLSVRFTTKCELSVSYMLKRTFNISSAQLSLRTVEGRMAYTRDSELRELREPIAPSNGNSAFHYAYPISWNSCRIWGGDRPLWKINSFMWLRSFYNLYNLFSLSFCQSYNLDLSVDIVCRQTMSFFIWNTLITTTLNYCYIKLFLPGQPNYPTPNHRQPEAKETF